VFRSEDFFHDRQRPLGKGAGPQLLEIWPSIGNTTTPMVLTPHCLIVKLFLCCADGARRRIKSGGKTISTNATFPRGTE
jgi:hypothetical protein